MKKGDWIFYLLCVLVPMIYQTSGANAAVSQTPKGFSRLEGHCYKAVYHDNASVEFQDCLRQCRLQTVKCMSFTYRFEKKRCILMWQRCSQADTPINIKEPDWLTYVKVDDTPLGTYNQVQGRCARQFQADEITAGVGVYFSQTGIKLLDCARLCNSHGLQLCKSFNYNQQQRKCELIFYWCNGNDIAKNNQWMTYVQKTGEHPEVPGFEKVEAKCERQSYKECLNCNFTKCTERCSLDDSCMSFSYRFGNYSRCRMNRDKCLEVDVTIDPWSPYDWASYNKIETIHRTDIVHPAVPGFRQIKGVCMTKGIGACPTGDASCSFKQCCVACSKDEECNLFWFNFEKGKCWRYTDPCKPDKFRTNPSGSKHSSSYNKMNRGIIRDADNICPEEASNPAAPQF